jgi:hypothetical protein
MRRDDRSPSIDEGAGPLSVALVTPGWPSGAFANGIIPYVADMAEEMRAAGHTVTVVAQHAKGGVDGVDVRESRPFGRPKGAVNRAVDALCYRVVNDLGQRRVIVRALAEECRALIRDRGLQLVEIEESHGWSRWLQEALPIPVVVRIHGPWFVNGPLRGAVEDARFRRQVRHEGRRSTSWSDRGPTMDCPWRGPRSSRPRPRWSRPTGDGGPTDATPRRSSSSGGSTGTRAATW